MLSERYLNEELSSLILQNKDFMPLPIWENREAWESIPDRYRQMWLEQGVQLLGYDWPVLHATSYMDYFRNGNRSVYEDSFFRRRGVLGTLTIAECLEGKGRFLNDIVNGIWAICEESSWCVPAHMYLSDTEESLPDRSNPLIDLFAADTAGLLSWVFYLLKERLDSISPQISKRIRKELDQRIFTPYLERNDFWWMGFGKREVNNWNPWCNSNCLTAVLLVEENSERRLSLLNKIIRSIDRFIDVQYPDGGCDEGAAYWNVAGGSLFDCLELMYLASNGNIEVYNQSLIKHLGQFVSKTFIDDSYYVNFADGSAVATLDSTLIYRYGKRIKDDSMIALGLHGFQNYNIENKSTQIIFLFREISGLFASREMEQKKFGEALYVRDAWLPAIQVMAAREEMGSSRGFYLAAKGGHNQESHNHNDIGQFVVYYNGKPFLIDAGVETYTAKTFGPRRYEIWTMQSAYHNLPTVHGLGQKEGNAYRATEVVYHCDDSAATLSMNIAEAYPEEADICFWKRTVSLLRSEECYIEVADECKLNKAADDIVLNLLSCHEPRLVDGEIILGHEADQRIQIKFETETFKVEWEEIYLADAKLRKVWGERLYRIQLSLIGSIKEAVWKLKIKRGGPDYDAGGCSS